MMFAGGLVAWVRNWLLPPSWQRLSNASIRLSSGRQHLLLEAGEYRIRRSLLDRVRDSARIVPNRGGRGCLIYRYEDFRKSDASPESANNLALVPAIAASIAIIVMFIVRNWN